MGNKQGVIEKGNSKSVEIRKYLNHKY